MKCNIARSARFVVLGLAVPLAAQQLTPIAANDNRTPAGALRDKTLSLQLDIRKGVWHPESETGEAFPVYAFGEAGKQLQVPAPTIRVPQGTAIDVTLHSTIGVPATLHGLHQRPGKDDDVVTVAPGATQHLRFIAGVPGTYLYWGRTPDGRGGNGRALDSTLGGALVVDAPGAPTNDRIFVFERWKGPTRTAINGKSWPFTERLNYQVGEKVHWRLVNASDLSHPMHLHGFHFQLDAEGDGEHYKVYEPGDQPQEFTHSVEIMQTFEMTWVPSEPGRWLYHCHRIPHMRLPVPVDAADLIGPVIHGQMHDHDMNMESDYSGMGGMIMGITVTGRSSIDTVTAWKPQRLLELAIGERHGDPRYYELSLRDLNTKDKPQMSTGLTGPVLVVTEGQQTEIAVVNHLKESTAMHWHGIELESYYDGVPGWGGIGDKHAPAVQPGESFSVRMIPPRAGTFMYHTHWHDAAQLTGGIHGPLIVMPAGQTYNAATDKSFLVSQSSNEPFGGAMMLMNGVPQPSTLRLKADTTYRFRFINITPSIDNLRVSLRNAAGAPVEWRLLAKDASNSKDRPTRSADQWVAVGETYDFEYRAASPQELTLTALNPGDNRKAVQTLIFDGR